MKLSIPGPIRRKRPWSTAFGLEGFAAGRVRAKTMEGRRAPVRLKVPRAIRRSALRSPAWAVAIHRLEGPAHRRRAGELFFRAGGPGLREAATASIRAADDRGTGRVPRPRFRRERCPFYK